MARTWVLWLAASVTAGCGGDSTSPGVPPPSPPNPDPVLFDAPLLGTAGGELFYGAYIDHGGPVPSDYRCGPKAYAGHRGVDILLRNFKVQDSGVTVVAAAAGTVAGTADGFQDRNTLNGAGGFGNHVVIDHGQGRRSIYGHLRRGSLLVAPGRVVTAGAPLGLVGSSGNSNWPHLHFEVQTSTIPVDPFEGPCNFGRASQWRAQPAYHEGFAVLDAGVTDQSSISFGALLERVPDAGPIRADQPAIILWLELFNIQADSTQLIVRDPGGTVRAETRRGRFTTFSTTFATYFIQVAGLMTPGRWRLEFSQKPLVGGPMALAHVQEVEIIPGVIPTPRAVTASAPVMHVWASGRDYELTASSPPASAATTPPGSPPGTRTPPPPRR